jgi:toluene monooxygenase system protein A
MPKLDRTAYYDFTRDMNWQFRYVSETEVFPEEQVNSYGVPAEAWWEWDEPYKLTYREY